VEWTDRYTLSDDGPGGVRTNRSQGNALDFARYQDRIADLTPRSHELPPGTHPFPSRYATWNTSLMFNIASYARQLMNDFLIGGGKIETAEFHFPSELSWLTQRVVINATGYGVRALWSDESLVPVRGQIAWLIPQPEVNYGVIYKNINILGRRDDIVVQYFGGGDMYGYNDANENPDRQAAEESVRVVAELYQRMRDMASRGRTRT
jgi:hypothetical protein